MNPGRKQKSELTDGGQKAAAALPHSEAEPSVFIVFIGGYQLVHRSWFMVGSSPHLHSLGVFVVNPRSSTLIPLCGSVVVR